MVVILDAGFQESGNQSDDSVITDSLPNLGQKLVVVHSVKELLKIDVDNPWTPLLQMLLGLLDCHVGTPLRSKAVACLRKGCVPLPLQLLHDGLLDEAIHRCGNAQLSYSFTGLWYPHPLHRFRGVFPL